MDHNNQFKQGREQFIKKILAAEYPDQPDKNTLSADEMSIFYRCISPPVLLALLMFIIPGTL